MRESVMQLPVVRSLLDRRAELPEWAACQRGVTTIRRRRTNRGSRSELLLLPKLLAEFGKPVQIARPDLAVLSFPGRQAQRRLASLARGGVRVRVLTNSLAATDEKSVHAGYVKRREALLRAGVQLFELKPEATSISSQSEDKDIGTASSKAGLHAKTYASMTERSSSARSTSTRARRALNTEMGVVIESRTLATRLATVIDNVSRRWHTGSALGDDGQIRWFGSDGQVFDTDPGSSWWDRLVVRIGSGCRSSGFVIRAQGPSREASWAVSGA